MGACTCAENHVLCHDNLKQSHCLHFALPQIVCTDPRTLLIPPYAVRWLLITQHHQMWQNQVASRPARPSSQHCSIYDHTHTKHGTCSMHTTKHARILQWTRTHSHPSLPRTMPTEQTLVITSFLSPLLSPCTHTLTTDPYLVRELLPALHVHSPCSMCTAWPL